jgi:SAM-dependent methyltransferase
LSVLSKTIDSLKRRGIGQTCIRAACALLARAGFAKLLKSILAYSFDLRHGVRTAGIIPLERLQIRSKNKELGTFYVATPRYEFRSIIARLGIDPARYVFVDLGCGMGRVVLYAMEHGFSRVTGVEFSPELAAIARSNVEKYSVRCRTPAQIVTGDAAEHALPKEPCVLWLFNPFQDAVTSQVLANVHEVFRAGNRDINIVWYNVTPNARPLFEAPWLHVIAGETGYLKHEEAAFEPLRAMELIFPYSILTVRGS